MLAYETKGLLIGERANPEVVKSIEALTDQLTEVEHVNEVLTMHMGPEFILVNISVDFKDGISSERLESTVARLDREIRNQHPLVKRVFVEAEAWAEKGSARKTSSPVEGNGKQEE